MARSVVVETSRIAAFPGFAALPAEELDELAAAMSELEIEAGATVITLDDFGTAIYLIELGEAEFCTTAEKRTRLWAPATCSARSGSS